MHTRIHTHIHTRIHTRANIHAYRPVVISICNMRLILDSNKTAPKKDTPGLLRMYVCVCVCMRRYVCICVRQDGVEKSVCASARMHTYAVHMRVCTCVRTHTHVPLCVRVCVWSKESQGTQKKGGTARRQGGSINHVRHSALVVHVCGSGS